MNTRSLIYKESVYKEQYSIFGQNKECFYLLQYWNFQIKECPLLNNEGENKEFECHKKA